MPDDAEHKEPVLTDPADANLDLPPAAQRALAEAEERRKSERAAAMPKELAGRGGPEPTRFGDWEKDGITHDF